MKSKKNSKSDEIFRFERLLDLERAKNTKLRREITVLRDKIHELIVEIS